jgi:hypothetical protein
MHAANEETAAHEVGHAFTIEPPTLCSRFNAVRCEELRAAAIGLTVMRGQLDAYEDEIFLRERAADRLASLWLGRAVDTTSGACGKRRRQVMARDVDRDLERAIAVGGGSTR